ncbi:polysaccharide deacetylase family protein [Ginsengibacter hankyongi]|uniref:Polysaccharide deacetylase family protein n=1 Tax=Ginsengibacter hankyongi TaxID=2607284 RepID=A0A5J5ILA1_9BACT|nr:polysaccharide deacetylase family protein [Ginsengibacter hankyongi]KAA9041790.1 polysaccharide deacetylase family protein [Ginsengibacter hankyongi]
MKKTEASILLFHRVHPTRDILWDPMDPKRFESILKFIKKNYTVLPLLEILETKPVNTKKPLAAITFDDGYRDFIDYSLPIMTHLKIPSSMYVVTDCICRNKPTWTFEVDYLFFHTKKLQINWTIDISFMPATLQKNKFANKKELIAFCLKFKQHIKLIPEQKRKSLIYDLLSSFNDVTIPTGLMMSWKEINQIINHGIEVGSHTVTHPSLATLDKVDIQKELEESKSALFKHTGINPKIISYPVGSYNQEVKEASAVTGYKYGLAVNHKIYDLKSGNNFEIPRIELYNEPFWKSWLRIKQYV